MSYDYAVESGQRFGKLVVTEWVSRKHRDIPVQCDCGTQLVTTRGELRARVRSCGCDRTYCRCGQPTIWRSARQMLTCGAPECAAQLRGEGVARALAGRRGNRGPERVEDPGYGGVHARARRALRGKPCALADDTCNGRLESALRLDSDPQYLRTVEGRTYSIDPDTCAAYRILCRSHHAREGRMWAMVRDHPEVGRALAVERIRDEHSSCSECPTCIALQKYDKSMIELGVMT